MVSSARDGERPNTNNMALTVKRIPYTRADDGNMRGVASNWLCELQQGDARSPEELPYFGPLQKYQRSQLDCDLAYSRIPGRPKECVQDRLRTRAADIAELLRRDSTHVYICGLAGLEQGGENALSAVGRDQGFDWPALRASRCEAGRFHIETY